MPFYYYDKKHLDNVEELLGKIKSPRNKAEANDVVNGFSNVLEEFKIMNPSLYYTKPKITGMKIASKMTNMFSDVVAFQTTSMTHDDAEY